MPPDELEEIENYWCFPDTVRGDFIAFGARLIQILPLPALIL